mgnify:CR=1 FL=1
MLHVAIFSLVYAFMILFLSFYSAIVLFLMVLMNAAHFPRNPSGKAIDEKGQKTCPPKEDLGQWCGF